MFSSARQWRTARLRASISLSSIICLELKGSSYDGVTVRHLLTMTSGVEWSEETGDPQSDVTENYIKLIAARRPNAVIDVLKRRPSASRPGTQYYYNSADTFLLGPILTRATAMNVAAYCSEKLWVPLGCEQDGFFMLDSDDGMEVLGSCSVAMLRDDGRIGLLMLADGIVNGKRIVPEGWVEQSTRPVAPGFAYDFEGKRPYGAAGPRSRFEGYGCLWWAYKNGDFQALGAFGQWIYVSPAEKLVIVMLGAVPRTAYMTAEQFRLHRRDWAFRFKDASRFHRRRGIRAHNQDHFIQQCCSDGLIEPAQAPASSVLEYFVGERRGRC